MQTSKRAQDYLNTITKTTKLMNQYLNEEDYGSLKKLIDDLEIVCPVSGTKNWTDIRKFNLMFSTKIDLWLIKLQTFI